jgi:hypothetical protein
MDLQYSTDYLISCSSSSALVKEIYPLYIQVRKTGCSVFPVKCAQVSLAVVFVELINLYHEKFGDSVEI